MLAAYLAGVGGNLAAWSVYGESHRGLGASGVVMGAVGLVAVQSATLWQRHRPNSLRPFASGLFAGALLFVLVGVNPEADVVAHLGGFITGLLLGGLLALVPRLTRQPWVNLATGAVFVVLVISPWWRALA